MSIADKIQKLEALANDPAATEGEKDTARRMAQKLRAKYGAGTHSKRSTFNPHSQQERNSSRFDDIWNEYQRRDQEASKRAHDWFAGRYKKRQRVQWTWHYHKEAKAEAGFIRNDDGKIKIDFTKAESAATDKQMAYIYVICNHFDIDGPEDVLTFDCASDFLKHWSPLYRKEC